MVRASGAAPRNSWGQFSALEIRPKGTYAAGQVPRPRAPGLTGAPAHVRDV